jgi:hypothetical protein
LNLFAVGAPDGLRAVAARLPFFPGREVQTAGTAAWISHTDGYVHVGDDGTIAMFSGRPITWGPGNPLDARFWLDPNELDGRYAGLRVVDGEVTVFTDALGAYPVYRHRDGAVSNNAFVLREGTSMRLDVLASLFGGGWSLSGDPVWEGVERIRPQPPAVLEADFDPERAAATLVDTVRALADWPGRPSIVPITAGRDSRLVLAATLAAGIDFETTTGGEPGHPDVEIGEQLARVAGVPWKPIEHDPHGAVEFVRDTTSPLWSKRLLPDLWAGRGRFHDEVLARLAPQLLEIPYERSPSRPRKLIAALKRRISGRDAFARILPEIREAVLAQPQHVAWEVLDRARVERLLASPPPDTMSRYYVWRLATVFGPSA